MPDAKAPGSDKDLVFLPQQYFATPTDAKNAAALLALYRFHKDRPLERKMPDPYRAMWLALVASGGASSGGGSGGGGGSASAGSAAPVSAAVAVAGAGAAAASVSSGGGATASALPSAGASSTSFSGGDSESAASSVVGTSHSTAGATTRLAYCDRTTLLLSLHQLCFA